MTTRETEFEYRYLLSIFTHALRTAEPHVNTIYRLIYIYIVSVRYLYGANPNNDKVIINKEIGVGDFDHLRNALAKTMAEGYVQLTKENRVIPGDALDDWVKRLLEASSRVKEDYQRIAYFSDVLIAYGEDVVLSLFFNEPNVTDAASRNREYISLSDNKLFSLLSAFEKIATEKKSNTVEKYDVFIRWLDYVLDKYLKEKLTDE